MLLFVAVILCLLGFLQSFRTSQYRRLVDLKESGNEPAVLEARCLRNCGFHRMDHNMMDSKEAFKAASRQSCFEECLTSKKKEDRLRIYEKGSSVVENQLLRPFSKRKKRNVNDGIVHKICPQGATNTTKNEYATVESKDNKQYENSNRRYYNISWKPINESSLEFTGYAFIYWNNYLPDSGMRYISRQKNETYVIYREPESSIDDFYFRFSVIVLPCQTDNISLKEKLDERNVNLTGISTLSSTVRDSPTFNKKAYALIVIGTLAGMVTIACVLRYKYFRKGGIRKSHMSSCPTDFYYDAFIIFNNKDQSWVDGTLLPLLEVEHGLKCCVHYRDFEPGKPFVENMTDSVQKSRNTIAVVSKNFFTSKFCKYELDQAIYKNVKEGNNGAIVIRIDDVSKDKLPDALKNKSFVDYSNSIERKTWHLKLIKVLKSNHTGMEERV